MILENFSPVALAPRLKDELYSSSLFSITDDFFKKRKRNFECSRKAWQKRYHLGQQEYFRQSILYHSLFMGGKKVISRWDYLDDLVNLLFSETPVYRVLNFQPSPLTSGRGFIISID